MLLLAILLVEMVAVIHTSGLLIIAIVVTRRHGDASAAYPLYAIRDRLIGSVVFEGVDRDNPWLISLYDNVNRILLHTNILSGPGGWSRAASRANHSFDTANETEILPLPDNRHACPAPIRAIAPDLRTALEHLLQNHLGIGIYLTAQERQRRRAQQKSAAMLLRMVTGAAPKPHAS